MRYDVKKKWQAIAPKMTLGVSVAPDALAA